MNKEIVAHPAVGHDVLERIARVLGSHDPYVTDLQKILKKYETEPMPYPVLRELRMVADLLEMATRSLHDVVFELKQVSPIDESIPPSWTS